MVYPNRHGLNRRMYFTIPEGFSKRTRMDTKEAVRICCEIAQKLREKNEKSAKKRQAFSRPNKENDDRINVQS